MTWRIVVPPAAKRAARGAAEQVMLAVAEALLGSLFGAVERRREKRLNEQPREPSGSK